MRVITMSNEAGMEMTSNMLASYERVGMPMDKVTLYRLTEGDQGKADYGTPTFNRMMRNKVEVILDAMETNEEVLWVDSDIVFLKNCYEDVRVRSMLSELCFQSSSSRVSHFCAGFFHIHSSLRTRSYLKGMLELMKKNPDRDDEYLINETYFQLGLKVTGLPYWNYPVGQVYFGLGDRGWGGWEKEEAYIVHNNFITGNDAKTERFKKFDLWKPDASVVERVEVKNWELKTKD